MASIEIIDNFFPSDMYESLLKFTESCMMIYGSKSHIKNDPHGHWLAEMTRTGRFHKEDASEHLTDHLRPVWDYVRPTLNHKQLVTSYINGHTYGTEGYFHTDINEPNHTTVIIYLVRGEWDPDWGGETIFIDDDNNIRSAIFPRANRVAVFPSNLNHCARGVTRKFNGIRRTLMFKTRLEINTSV